MATISTTKNTHSVAQPNTKLWIRIEVAAGFTREMINQMPTPVMPPMTMVISRKNLACFLVNSRIAGLFSRNPLRSARTR